MFYYVELSRDVIAHQVTEGHWPIDVREWAERQADGSVGWVNTRQRPGVQRVWLGDWIVRDRAFAIAREVCHPADFETRFVRTPREVTCSR